MYRRLREVADSDLLVDSHRVLRCFLSAVESLDQVAWPQIVSIALHVEPMCLVHGLSHDGVAEQLLHRFLARLVKGSRRLIQ